MKYTIIRTLEDNSLNWKKYTLRELAEKVNRHFSALSRIRSGKERCSEELYLRLKEALK